MRRTSRRRDRRRRNLIGLRVRAAPYELLALRNHRQHRAVMDGIERAADRADNQKPKRGGGTVLSQYRKCRNPEADRQRAADKSDQYGQT